MRDKPLIIPVGAPVDVCLKDADLLEPEIEVTDAMRDAGAMKLIQVGSCTYGEEEDAAESIYRAMVMAKLGFG